jgi:hypothetical protein
MPSHWFVARVLPAELDDFNLYFTGVTELKFGTSHRERTTPDEPHSVAYRARSHTILFALPAGVRTSRSFDSNT